MIFPDKDPVLVEDTCELQTFVEVFV